MIIPIPDIVAKEGKVYICCCDECLIQYHKWRRYGFEDKEKLIVSLALDKWVKRGESWLCPKCTKDKAKKRQLKKKGKSK